MLSLFEDAMALSAKDWEVVMRTPLFKAMGPTISRAMISDRAPRTYARGERSSIKAIRRTDSSA